MDRVASLSISGTGKLVSAHARVPVATALYAPGQDSYPQSDAPVHDRFVNVLVTPDEAARGIDKVVLYASESGPVTIRIPAGIRDGQKLRLAGHGAPVEGPAPEAPGGHFGDMFGQFFGQPPPAADEAPATGRGDLYCTVRVVQFNAES